MEQCEHAWVKHFLRVSYSKEIATCIWLLVGLERSLKSSHKEALKKTLLGEDYSDITSPTSNKIPDILMDVTVIYDTF